MGYHYINLTKEQKADVLKVYKESLNPGHQKLTLRMLGEKYKVSAMTIYNILNKYGKWEFSYTDPLTIDK